MTDPDDWVDVGSTEELKQKPLQQVVSGGLKLAVSYADGAFGVISGVCNHVGGPLGEGTLDGEYVVCPWHHWKFHRATGEGEPGYEVDKVPRHELKEEGGRLLVKREASTKRNKSPHPPHALERTLERSPGGVRVLGISTTNMERGHPRYSTSDALLNSALAGAKAAGRETQLISLRDLAFRNCEGFYSKSARACTWPCSITQMDPDDQMERVYEAIVFWADVVLVALPIRWGVASALYFKMAERLNCVQNQITLRERVLIKSKVAGFVITGGQDNVQGVAGQALQFFSELGFQFPQFPYIAHSRGWSAEDMENNVRYVQESAALHDAAKELEVRSSDKAAAMLESAAPSFTRAGRKADGNR